MSLNQQLRDLPIRKKLVGMSLVSTGFAVALATFGYAFFGIENYRRLSTQQLDQLSIIVGESITAALSSGDERHGEQLLSLLKLNHEIATAAIYGKDGQRFAYYVRPGSPRGFYLPDTFDGELGSRWYSFETLRIAKPILSAKQQIGVISIVAESEQLYQFLERMIYISCLIFFVSIGVAWAFSHFLQSYVSSPILQLANLAGAVVRDRNMSLRARSQSQDEIGFLIDQFNIMLDQLEKQTAELKEKQFQLIQTAKLAALGEMSAGVAHELNNPLQFIKGFNNQIRVMLQKKGQVSSEDIGDFINEIDEGAERMKKLIQHFREFSRQADINFRPTLINIAVERSFILFKEQLRQRNITIVKKLAPENPFVWGDSNQLEQVLMNIIGNAKDAIEEAHGSKGGEIIVATHCDDSWVTIEMQDNGCGISKENIERIFNPFFTTKEVGKGTGLGLSVTHSLVKNHQGEITCESTLDQGTTFHIRFPRYRPSSIENKRPATENDNPHVLTWTSELDVQVNHMNQEHKKLIQMMNRLTELHRQGKSVDQVRAALYDFVTYTRSHFKDEEDYMESVQFSDTKRHQLMHQEILAKIARHEKEFEATGQLSEKFIHFLQTWVAAHIGVNDKKYADTKK